MPRKRLVRAGDLYQQVTIESPVYTESASGALTITDWTPGRTVWADVQPQTAREAPDEAARQQVHRTYYVIKIRFAADVTERHRLDWQGHKLQITGIVPDALRTELEITAVERGTADRGS